MNDDSPDSGALFAKAGDAAPAVRTEDLEAALGPFMGIGMVVLCGLTLVGGWAGDRWPIALGLVLASGVTVGLLGSHESRHGRSTKTEVLGAASHLSLAGALVAMTGGIDSPLWTLFLMGALIGGLTDSTGSRWAVPVNAVVAAGVLFGCRLVVGPLSALQVGAVLVRVSVIALTGLVAREAMNFAMSQATLRRQVELEKLQEGGELRTLLTRVNTPMLGLDLAGRVQAWNHAASRLWGRQRAEVLGLPAIEVLQPSEHGPLEAQVTLALEGSPTGSEELSLDLASGTRRVLLSATPRRSIEEELVGCWLICHDITELHEARSELEATVDRRTGELRMALGRERELRQLQSRFITAASHQFRTPLSSILAARDILASHGDQLSPEQRERRLGKIQSEILKLGDLLDDLLKLSQTGAFQSLAADSLFEPSAVCQDVISQKELLYPEHGFSLEVSPGTSDTPYDAILLRSALSELLENACKYSDPRSSVEVRLWKTTNNLNLSVTDHGVGIPEDELPHLFEPFQRGTNVLNLEGTGLGLSVLHASVLAREGHLAIQSVFGEGTRAEVSLPVRTN